ncbi:carboxylate-amine ligase [Streptomyces sp. URMC 123]|uniref:carboxylate-amine ligase n=1 Tax=Streptomyces sp. URMC 123 TaxID=3423403 RepID=UPI003F1DAEB9
MITLGVEEEYLLIDPDTGMPVPRGQQVRALVSSQAGPGAPEVQSELLQAQVEVATPICRTLDDVGGHLLRLRHALAAAAEKAGCRLAACGAAPDAPTVPVPVTNEHRYRELRRNAARLVDEQLVNGMHVHVAVPDRDTAVTVLNRVRPWLPVLVAMAGNSPLWLGTDTGFASWRTVVFGRWPVSGPPPAFDDLQDYEGRIDALLDTGTIYDRGQLYWHARVSERYPTVEIRAADVQLRADEAVLFAGIVRALVATAIREDKDSEPLPATPPELLSAATWLAARRGLSHHLVGLRGSHAAATDVVRDLMRHIRPALEESGDLPQVASLAHRLLREGTGAERQRRALREGGRPALYGLITAQTTAS